VQKWAIPVANMVRNTKILPGLVFSVAILESSKPDSKGVWLPANSALAKAPNNNLFGITAGSNWKGATVNMSDAGNPRTFRVYPNQTESFKDFIKLLQTSRYVNAGINEGKTVFQQAEAMKRGGYAEVSDYADRVAKVWQSLGGTYDAAKEKAAATGQTVTNVLNSPGSTSGSGSGGLLMAGGLGLLLIGLSFSKPKK
jgi:flagellum-specific peptidoglycan hydrolase FlgJ